MDAEPIEDTFLSKQEAKWLDRIIECQNKQGGMLNEQYVMEINEWKK